jgi:hypothetical protein
MNSSKPPRVLTARRDARAMLRHTQQRSARLLHNYLLRKVSHLKG